MHLTVTMKASSTLQAAVHAVTDLHHQPACVMAMQAMLFMLCSASSAVLLPAQYIIASASASK
jgi:hypothetical protein